jgi:5-(carboxyamino)imidazole ribonucleotide synthase
VKRIGVLGAGQLGRMLAWAGYPLGFEFSFFDTAADAPAGQLAPLVVGDYEDEQALKAFAKGLDAVTYEFENVPVSAVKILESHVEVYPPARALEYSQDRLIEKTLFRDLGIAVPDFYDVTSLESLQDSLERTGFPAVLKTRRMGYDGKGQAVIRYGTDVETAWQALKEQPLIVESFVPFEGEVSIIAVRNKTGETKFYPLIENYHEGGILRESIVPAEVLPELQQQAESYARLVMKRLEYVGVLTIEFFVVKGQLVANEMAPRVHNSGHWTIEGAQTSQFENHVRAVADLPLGGTQLKGASLMLNLIGVKPNAAEVLKTEDAHLHWYGKTVRPGRKVGHITITGKDRQDVQEKAKGPESLIKSS